MIFHQVFDLMKRQIYIKVLLRSNKVTEVAKAFVHWTKRSARQNIRVLQIYTNTKLRYMGAKHTRRPEASNSNFNQIDFLTWNKQYESTDKRETALMTSSKSFE